MESYSDGIHLQIQSLSKFFGERDVLQAINLDVHPGEFVAIVGRSGCGKSTLLRLVAGLETPSQGGIFLNGAPLRKLNPATRIMFQDSRLLPWQRVLQNVGVGLTPRRKGWQHQALHVLQQVGLEERAKDWTTTLSGGQRQRVALARALAGQPRLLLLDEPLGALDALTRIEMQELIVDLWQQQGFTALLVTHDVEEAVMLADRVLLIEQGRLVMDLPIRLARPRQRGSGAFAHLVESILQRVLQKTATSPTAEQKLDAAELLYSAR